VTRIIILIGISVYLLVRLYSDFTSYEAFSIALFVYSLLKFIDNLGKKLVILDIAILVTIFTCLVVPISGYHHFGFNNRFARTWVMYMRVPSDVYFAFMIPATLAMMIGMKIQLFYKNSTFRNQAQYMTNVKKYLAGSRSQGLILVGIGLVSSVVESYVPTVIAQVFFLLRYLMFVGVFYAFYSDLPRKKLILGSVFLVLLLRSISAGMFGEMVFMSAMTVILISLGSRRRFITKFSVIIVGIFGVLVLQSVKPAFRKKTWFGKSVTSKVGVFADIFVDKLSNPTGILSNERELFVMYGRFNQGQIISNVLYSVPARYPYANGETIFISLAASLVPRVLWPDKPEAGGAFNFKRFLGIQLKGWSANISPFGEAYANFGVIGGIIFMFFFGLLFNFLFQWLLKLTVTNPSLILWFPYFFFYAVSIETDVLSMVNSFTKAGILAFMIYKFFPKVFKMKI
jgi:hypothetical protein